MCETESLHVSLIRLLSFAVCSSLSCPVQTLRRSLPPPILHTVDRHTGPPQQVCGSVSRHCCSGHKQTDRVHAVAQTAPELNSGWFSYSLMDRYRKSLSTGVIASVCVSTPRSSMELSDDPRPRGPWEAPPALLPCVSPAKSNSYSAVQQQSYSASIFLQRKDMLEKVRQVPLMLLAMVCVCLLKVRKWS